MFAMVPQSKDTPPTFYHVTWKCDQYGKWKTLNTSPYMALFKDLRNCNPMTETMYIQLHSSDFAKLPLSAGIRWLSFHQSGHGSCRGLQAQFQSISRITRRGHLGLAHLQQPVHQPPGMRRVV